MRSRRIRRRKDGRRPTDQVGPRFQGGLQGGRYRPLDSEGVLRVHDAALQVLERTGAEVLDSECRNILLDAGARVDQARDRVFFPREIVEGALKTVNRDVVLYSRDGRCDLHLQKRRVHLGTGGAAVQVLDLESGEVRESRLRDLYDIGRLIEDLDNIHFYLRPVVARDVSNNDIDVNTFYACMAATHKHVMGGCYYSEKVGDLRALADLIAGGGEQFLARPFLSLNLGWLVSPLRFAPETTETLTAAVRAGIPVALVSAPLAGATAPASLVGTLVQVVAEELAGITYVQLLKPGHPILMGGMPLVADLRTGNMIGGSAELALMNAASAQMAQHYGLPVYNSSALTDSKVPDIQAGFEKGLTTAVTALAGSEYNHHSAGMLESMLTVAYEQYVIDDDLNGMAMRLVHGLEISEASLSVDVIHEVCHGDGHFLGHPQTLSLMNSEYYYPHTADRSTRREWRSTGGPDMRASAREKARHILKTSFPEILPSDLDVEIRQRFDIRLPREVMALGGYP